MGFSFSDCNSAAAFFQARAGDLGYAVNFSHVILACVFHVAASAAAGFYMQQRLYMQVRMQLRRSARFGPVGPLR